MTERRPTFRHRPPILWLTLGWLPVSAAAATFDQGPVTLRAPRNAPASTGVDHPETEHLFGLTSGSDNHPQGALILAIEGAAAIGRREGRYGAFGQKLELTWAITDDLSIAPAIRTGYWNIAGNATLPRTDAARFLGAGAELRWRWLRRGPSPVGLTLQMEPSVSLADEVDGTPGTGYALENRLILDTELIAGRLWAAANLIWDLERFRPWTTGSAIEEGSVAGASVAVSARITDNFFLGGELRHLTAFDGLTLGRQVGRALYLGPNAFWQITDNAWLSLAWSVQVAGHENNDPRRLDLTNFPRNLVRIRFGWEF